MFAAGHHLLLSFLRPSIAFTMDFNVGDRVFYTRSNGMRGRATVVGFAPDGLLHLEYFQDAVTVVNRQCKVESISFAIPSADSPPPSTRSPSPPPDDRGRSPSKSAIPSPRAKPRAPKTTKQSREAGKQLAATMKTLKGGLSSVSSEDWKEVLEWLLKRKEDTGKMKWDDAAWHFLPRWGIADSNDPQWDAWRRLFQTTATHKYRYVAV